MGVISKKAFRFGEFAPDSDDYNNPQIEELENGIPMYGGYRSVRKAEVQSSVSLADNFVTGAHAHLITDDVNVQHGKTDSDTTVGDWVDSTLTLPATDLYSLIDETTPDDTDFMFWEDTGLNPAIVTPARLEVEDLVDPAVLADSDYHLDVRYRGYIDDGATSGTLTLDVYEGATPRTTTESWVATGDSEFWDGTWRTKRLTLTDADANAIGDFTDINIRFDGAVVSAAVDDSVSYPTSDVENDNNWQDQDGGVTDIYQSIDSVVAFGDVPDDTKYISNPEGTSDDTSYVTGLSSSRFPYGEALVGGVGAGVDLKMRVRTDDDTNISYEVEIGDPIRVTHADTVGSDDNWTTKTYNISAFEISQLLDDGVWDNIPIRVNVSGITDGAAQSSVPTGTGSPNDWLDKGGGAASHTDVAAEDSNYIKTAIGGAETSRFTLPAMSAPSDHSGTKVRFKYRYGGGRDRPKIRFKLYRNGTSNSYESGTYTCETTWQEKEWTLDPAESENLDWGDTFTLEVTKLSQGSTVREAQIDYIEIVSAGGTTKLLVGDVWAEVPFTQGFHISWADLIVPSSSGEVRGDKIRMYAGSKERIYEVSDSGWTNRTRFTTNPGDDDYGQGAEVPQTWNFCSWGGNVIATNYEDDVQYLDLEGGATEFAKLTTEADATEYSPKAKFCDVVQNYLVLGNIGDVVDGAAAAYTDAFSYTIWWSQIENPPKFKIGDFTNLSDLQHLRQTPGEITGFVGGEAGTIFKRDSIYRMSWVGGNLVFRFDVVARGIGTANPQSVLDVNGNIFFYGHNDFYVMQAGGGPVPLAEGKIKAMLLESFWGERAINRDEFDLQVDNDLRVVGTYDQFTGLIFWAVDNYHSNSSYESKSDIVVYNPKDGRFGYIRDSRFTASSDLGITHIVSSPNVQQDDVALLNNLNIFTYDARPGASTMNMEKFSGPSYLQMTLLGNAVSADKIGAPEAELMSLMQVRPFYGRIGHRDYESDSEGSVLDVPFTVTAYASLDPLMIDDVTSATCTQDNENDNKWAAMSSVVSGEFWKFKTVIPAWTPVANTSTYGAIKTLLGLQLHTTHEGKH